MNSTAALPDGLREALGQVIADQRREWRREREVIEAQSGQLIAELRAEVVGLRAQIVEMQAELRAKIDARLAELKDGVPGERGPQGEVGPAGPAGPQGAQGEIGPRGDQGAPGERGEIGPQGERGIDGATGPQGDVGERGETGAEGPAGRDGAAGETGPQGPAGPQGERGEAGAAGAAGSNGRDGATGPQGPAGERGIAGSPGKLPVISEWQDRVYHESDVVTLDGSTYQAQRDTGKAPPHEDWRCIARAGNDGVDGRSLNFRSTWSADETYAALDVATLDGGSFVALRDDPGPCPGDGWRLFVQRGKPGRPGEKGERGERGSRGDPGPAVVGIEIDDNGVVTVTNADGSTAAGDFYPVLSRIER